MTDEVDDAKYFDIPVSEAIAEKCYRRGFYQGAAAAFYAMRDGFTLSEIDEWLHGTLLPWRLRASRFRPGQKPEMEYPVWLSREDKR